MGRGTPKKNEPETPQLHESRNPPGFEPLRDLQAGICDPKYPFDIGNIKPLLFGCHCKSADRFRVVASGFYHHITPQVHSGVDFIVWIRDSYDTHRDAFVSPQGNIIFSLLPMLSGRPSVSLPAMLTSVSKMKPCSHSLIDCRGKPAVPS